MLAAGTKMAVDPVGNATGVAADTEKRCGIPEANCAFACPAANNNASNRVIFVTVIFMVFY
jgi:hypothetical protein